jgi:predicted metalloprotease with PDZ domain
MSKSRRPALLYLLVLLAITGKTVAQDLIATVRIEPGSPSIAVVEGKFQKTSGHRQLHFPTNYAIVSKLDERISEVKLTDGNGKLINAHLAGPGRYIAESDFASWSYRADISPLKDRFASAHLTWSSSNDAVIMLGDLLPQGHRSALITLEVPDGWTVFSTERSLKKSVFEVAEIEKAVFYVGRAIRAKAIRSAGAEIELSLTGEWHFSDDEATQMADSIFAKYSALFAGLPAKKVHIAVRPFPNAVPLGQWEGGSRGANITIVSSAMPFKSQSLQRLHEQLRHEIFHLWIPNGVNLTGNYDWFYEGFALYQSLKLGVAVNRIRFDDLLDTISRASDIDASPADKGSIIDASKARWNGSNTQLYARGILIAFACDLAMLRASRGKRSISDVLRRVFDRHRASPPEMANEAILKILRLQPELRPIVDNSITNSRTIDWPDLLRSGGLEMYTRDQLVRIKVVDKPSSRQREVLDRLGYNNWRNLPRTDK